MKKSWKTMLATGAAVALLLCIMLAVYMPATAEGTASGTLSTVDYLAFSAISYKDMPLPGEECTVRKILQEKNLWNAAYEECDFTWGELCTDIADWQLVGVSENTGTGFYAAVFQSPDSSETVIAYRGSRPLSLEMNEDTFLDWIVHDIALECLDTFAPNGQVDNALTVFNTYAKRCSGSTITLTGHSLGGLLADYVSCCSGCKAVTFNSVSALDAVYYNCPEELALHFSGVDCWNFEDHINPNDILAGNYIMEIIPFSPDDKVKVAVAHDCEEIMIGTTHSMWTLLKKDKPEMYPEIKTYRPKDVVIRGQWGLFTDNARLLALFADGSVLDYLDEIVNHAVPSVQMGTSGNDIVGLRSATGAQVLFGGDGDDELYGGFDNDIIVPGNGNDYADGGLGNDTYIVTGKTGTLRIDEYGGKNVIRLIGYDESKLRVEKEDKGIKIYYGDVCIVDAQARSNLLTFFRICTFEVETAPSPVEEAPEAAGKESASVVPISYTEEGVPTGSGSPVGVWEAVNLREVLIDETVATLGCSREEAERYVDEMGELYARIEFCEDGTVRMERSIGYDAGTGDGTWTADDDGFNVTEENFYPRRNSDYGGIWIEVTEESGSFRILPVYRFVWNGDCLSATKVDFSASFWMEDGEPVQESGPAVLFRRAGNVPVEEEEEEFAPVPADFRSPVGSWEAVNLREVISAAYELSGKSPEEAEQIVNAGKGLFMRMEFRADGTFSMEGDMGSGASYADGEWLVTETDGGTGIMMLVGNEPAGLLMWNGDCLSASGLGVDILFEKTGEPDATETGSASSSFHAGDIIRFGKDYKWIILDMEGSYATLLLSSGYYTGSFDSTLHVETRAVSLMDYRTYGQACWMYSELRQWLNSEEEQFQARDADIGYDNYEQALSGMGLVAAIEWESDAKCAFNGEKGFLCTFTPAERSIMVPVEITSLAPYTMVKTNGYTHTSVDLDRLYSVGTGTLTTTDLVYLLSAREYADYAARGINVYTTADGKNSFPQSWTRDSYDYNLAGYYSYYGMEVVTVTNGYFSSASAESVAAVRPVCRIDLSKIGAFSGSGTADDPYCLNLAPDEEEDTDRESPVGSGAVFSDSPYAQVGSIVTYGTYPQTAEGTGAPIEWLVLDYDANTNRALLISRYGLDCMRFDRDHEYSEGIESGKWDTCTLRAWLNGEFLNTAFEPALRGAIAETRLTPEENRGYITLTPEAETVDRIFLLSMSEARKYFASDADRMCSPTLYAVRRGASAYDTQGTPEGVSCWWWLRTRGDGYNGGTRVATVIDDGSVVDFGYAYFETNFAVRPAFWIDLSAL